MPMGVDSATRGHMWHGEEAISFFLSLDLHLLGHFLHFWTGWTQNTRITFVSQFTVLLPVSFPPARFSDWHVVPLWFHPTIKNDSSAQGEGIFLFLGVIPREADKHKKATQPKLITKLTSNQTEKKKHEKKNEHLLQFQRWTAAGASCSFSGSWCHSIFDAFCVSFFVFLSFFPLSFSSNYSSSEPHKHGSVAPGSPSEGRTYSLAMYKKSKLNQKCCSWCLFYTVVLLAFCYCNYMMKISKLYQITWRLTYINHMELQTFKEKLLSQKTLLS